MKYGVVGNQKGWTEEYVHKKLSEIVLKKTDKIISGGAEGVDTYAQTFAKLKGLTMIIHYPNNDLPSPRRYFERNFDIAASCDTLIAFDKKSGRAGTKNTVAKAKKLGRKIIEFKTE